jgi:hypothetical protein
MLGAGYVYAVFGKFAAAVVVSTTSGADVLLYRVQELSLEELGNRYSEKLLAGSDQLLVKSIG